MDGFPLHRFEEFGALARSEIAMIARLAGPPRQCRKLSRIRPAGVRSNGFFLLVDGWATSSYIVADGRRQILKVHLPGDALGTPSMCMTETVEELTALTDTTIVEVGMQAFGRLFDDHPRMAAKFLLSVQMERVTLMDRIVSIGKTSGAARIAAFLLDLVERLEPLGLMTDGTFHMMLTQEQIGDVVSLTAVHTNRSLKAIEDQGLIARARQRYTILDRDGLERLASRARRERVIDPPWLPAARREGAADAT